MAETFERSAVRQVAEFQVPPAKKPDCRFPDGVKTNQKGAKINHVM